jgi:tRNA-dihydrouridine synthase A
MMDWTDRHCRALHRQFTRRALLYTEMVTAPAVIHGDRARLLGFDACEHPLALQLGGSDPAELAEAARIGEDLGYDEINLNVGCPSDRVQSGRFGACLMLEPQLVAECMAAIRAAVSVPATVKCRIGVDDQDPEVALYSLVDACAAAGVETFIVHARKAWLQGLSPKENRDIPPLDYGLDGVMLGRATYHTPETLGRVDRLFYGEGEDVDAETAIARYRPYMAARLSEGVHLAAMTRHMLGLFHGAPGARAWRRILTVEGVRAGAGLEVLDKALDAVRQALAQRETRDAERASA